jgi:hypothetical protein
VNIELGLLMYVRFKGWRAWGWPGGCANSARPGGGVPLDLSLAAKHFPEKMLDAEIKIQA